MDEIKKQGIWRCLIYLVLGVTASVRAMESGGSVILHQHNMTKFTARVIHAAGYHLHTVQHLSIIDAPKLQHIAVEDLVKMPNLKSLFITQAPMLHKMAALPPLPELRTFMVTTSGLTEVPNLNHVHDHSRTASSVSYLLTVDLEGNHIKRIPPHALRIRADQVSLNYNLIEEVPANAFKNAQINRLSFKGNTNLRHLDENAFVGNIVLRQLDLSNTAIKSLPTKGLENLQVLRIEKTPSLTYIPSIYEFQKLEKAYLTHHFHCCAFAFPERHDPARHALYEQQVGLMAQKCAQNSRDLNPPPVIKRSLVKLDNNETENDVNSSSSSTEEYTSSDDGLISIEDYVSDSGSFEDMEQEFHEPVENIGGAKPYYAECGNFSLSPRQVQCTPLPDALNPCEDVMGWTWLRASVWIVITAAVIGNFAVLLVLSANRSELTVSRFLMCNLAIADLFTGLYLFMLAVVDLRSYGEFFNYAYDWQYGVGCKIAGFLSVFSGQLSVFTLTIVTLERWFAITYAIYLERRISMVTSTKIMICGWAFSFFMAGLPLVGVSDYSSTSICLPVESENLVDGLYQGSIFLTNAVAWVIIVVCYVQIYRSLGGSGDSYGGRAAAAAAERKIANKMALLIGTDLLCWAPVAFFGVTALAGVPLVDVSHGKVLLVFFYPLNACANPFLYAILTKQYRRDLLQLIGRTGWCSWLVNRYKLGPNAPTTGHTHPSMPAPLMPLVETIHISRDHSEKPLNGDSIL